ncbi:hypothetical protein K504DRAFT_400323 [Pleomassaria siparia CBS 279.74]|uniref:C2H2-type domain-containing protein n=1 Tax=Pleomassaria siparia CBS 279.74 TaxID=1314801 RepID=A0A6G1KGL9_9PLEO|nr:hypothetical protein K504DRAFT_400323 [Pleomassaria siparia CBS 279.74]
MTDWEKSYYASFTLWDIDREFQSCHDAYEQCLARDRRKRTIWERFSCKNQGDQLTKALSLGRQVEDAMETGQDRFGVTFERGDSTCQEILAAQLHRTQHEIKVPLLDCAYSAIPVSVPYDDLLTAAKGVRRACLSALRDLHERLQNLNTGSFLLPPPRFSVKFCPFALQLQQESSCSRKSFTPSFHTKKVRPHDRHDEREICPHCSAHISVSAHSGLPAARRQLFQAHIECTSRQGRNQSAFACTSCYKTFEDSYGFLEHVFQKQLGSERSCLKRWSSAINLHSPFMESNPALVERCLKNCLNRETMRTRDTRKIKVPGMATGTRHDSMMSRL